MEIKILMRLFTPEEAELTLKLSAIPEPAQAIHKRVKAKMTLPEQIIKLDQLCEKGLIHRLQDSAEPRYGKMISLSETYEDLGEPLYRGVRAECPSNIWTKRWACVS